ncbi:MAG: type II toxin-antitoxin system VapC family toxin [Myxococcota bacterium]
MLQEVLHRYVAINRRDAIGPALDALLEVVEEVFPIEREDALAARDVVLGASQLSARDAIHVAVMRRRGVERIITFDRGFDGVPGITRVT